MNEAEKELIFWRDYLLGTYQGPNSFENARNYARTNISQGKEPNAMQIVYSYVCLLDETIRNHYQANQGKTASSYCGFSETEQNSLIEVCKKANGLGIAIGGGAAGAYIGGSLFGVIGAVVGGVLGATAGSKYNDSDRNKIFGVVREAFFLYFDILIRHNNENYERCQIAQNKFIELISEFGKKNNLTDEDLVKFGEEALKQGTNIAYFKTVKEFEDLYFKMYPKKNAPSEFSNSKKPAIQQLDELIGLSSVKTQVKRLRAVLVKDKDDLKNVNLNMCFYGNAGTGKTVVARLIANILYEEGILKTNKLIETDRSGLVGEYVGQTAPKTHAVFEKALDGVLFIDEAYTLNGGGNGSNDYGKEAIAALIADMENYRGRICVILAGYKDDMEEMIATNQGFDSRINRKIDFPDYTTDELMQIFDINIKKYGRTINSDARNECEEILNHYSKLPKFANGRTVRNLVESLRDIQSERTVDTPSDKMIKREDVETYKKENNLYF